MGKGAGKRLGSEIPWACPPLAVPLGKLPCPSVFIFSVHNGDNIYLEGWLYKCSINIVWMDR